MRGKKKPTLNCLSSKGTSQRLLQKVLNLFDGECFFCYYSFYGSNCSPLKTLSTFCNHHCLKLCLVKLGSSFLLQTASSFGLLRKSVFWAARMTSCAVKTPVGSIGFRIELTYTTVFDHSVVIFLVDADTTRRGWQVLCCSFVEFQSSKSYSYHQGRHNA